MSSQIEDTMYEIHTALTESKLWGAFDKQLKKMSTQPKHKWKSVCEKWEYAYNKVKKNNGQPS
jgi:hypothetical protein